MHELPFPARTPPTPDTPRHIRLGDKTIPYRLTRGPRKTIGLTIDQAGLRVGAPTRAGIGEIEILLYRHADWVLKKLDAWQHQPAFILQDGARLPWLGGEVCLILASDARRAAWSTDGSQLRLPATNAAVLLEKTLRTCIRAVLGQRLADLAVRLGVDTPPLTLSSARTRWGSCNRHGRIRLNWRLGFMPPEVIDYVVAHELAHLKEMNHGPRFWAIVETLCPAWRQRRAELKQLGTTLAQYWRMS